MIKHKIYIILFFFASLISIYSNYKVWVSSRFQSGVIPDFNSQSFSSDNYMKFETIDLDYPNLGATALPMKGFYAKYHITFNNYYKALEILRSEENSNRYFKLSYTSQYFVIIQAFLLFCGSPVSILGSADISTAQ